MLVDVLKILCQIVPPFVKSSDKKLEANLSKIGFTCNASSYISTCVLLSIASLLVTFPTFFLLGASPYFSIAFAAFIFLFLCHWPALESKRLEKKIESELPIAVYLTYCDLSMGLLPEKCFSSLKSGELAKEFAIIQSLITRGLPLNLVPVFYTPPSKNLLRFVSLTLNSNLLELKKLYGDLLEIQRNKLKEYAAKSNLVSMCFISVAAIVPALFSAIVLLGPMLGFTFTSIQVFLFFVVVFPLVDYCLLYYLESEFIP